VTAYLDDVVVMVLHFVFWQAVLALLQVNNEAKHLHHLRSPLLARAAIPAASAVA